MPKKTAEAAPDLPPLGRDTDLTMELWSRIAEATPIAPRLFQGATTPRKSPNLARFDHGYPLDATEENGDAYYQVRGFCFPAGARVSLADGRERSIEDVGVGNRVIRHDGTPGRVTEVMSRDYSGEMVSIDVAKWHWPIHCTAEHPVAVVNSHDDTVKWVAARDIRKGDFLLRPAPIIAPTSARIDVRRYIDGEVFTDSDTGRCRLAHSKAGFDIPSEIAVDERFATFIGLYIAEGGLRRRKHGELAGITLTFHQDETDHHRFVCEAIEVIFGLKCLSAPAANGSKAWVIRCDSVTLAAFLQGLCGRGALEKHVDVLFHGQTEDVRMALLRGWLHGDGHRSPLTVERGGVIVRKRQVCGVSSCQGLLRDFFRLSTGLGLSPALSLRERQAHQNAQSGVLYFFADDVARICPGADDDPAWEPKLRAGYRSFTHKFGSAVRVGGVVHYHTQDPIRVYNLEVDGEHSYLVDGIAVHNCVGWGTAHVQQFLHAIPGRSDGRLITSTTRRVRGQRLSPGHAYALSRMIARQKGVSLWGDGSIVSYAIEGVATYGSLLWTDWPSTPAQENKQSNSQFPSAAQLAAGKAQAVTGYARCENAEHMLELNAAGHPLVVGTSWLRGMAATDKDGNASVSGWSVGGHCYCIIDHDRDADWVLIKNSHPQYGQVIKGPRYAGSKGYSNLARLPLKAYMAALFDERSMSRGNSEAFAVIDARGFAPRVEIG
jgi:hypothetical protein